MDAVSNRANVAGRAGFQAEKDRDDQLKKVKMQQRKQEIAKLA